MTTCRTACALALLATLTAAPALGQCILANPSFEIDGTGGALFGAWNQFGGVGRSGDAAHGSQAARISGPNTGVWDVSGFWQTHDGSAGEQWAITGHVRVPGSRPLAGAGAALVNVEWRDANGDMIDYDSFAVADAASPRDTWLDFDLVSAPAPAGTAFVVFLVGNLQGPADPVADVHFDQLTFFSTAAPTIDDVQWNDFPGGRSVMFGGHAWRVKGPGYYGPGPNWFGSAPTNVWVDGDGALHLTLQQQAGNWVATEVVTEEALGYGDYVVTTRGRLDLIDPQAVLGIFLWEYGPCWDYAYTWWNAFNEIDIEYSRWENPAADIAQFVAQPYDWGGNRVRFDATFDPDEIVSHAMRWLPDRVEYRVWRGDSQDEETSPLVRAWTYTGPHIPRPEQPRLHLNLWRIAGNPAAAQEVVFTDFTFVPAGGATAVGDPDMPAVVGAPAGRLWPAAPNPFNPQTTLRYTLTRNMRVSLKIFDASGRLLRTLVDDVLEAGAHRTMWDGRDAAGRTMASGIYFAMLAGPDFAESGRLVLLK